MTKARFHLERTQFIARDRSEVFAFFAQAENLEAITPEFLDFEILTPKPINVAPGTLIDYRIRLFGIPLRWRTRIETFEPEERFTDLQLRGPYRHWHHSHEFVSVAGGTVMKDVVQYDIGFGFLGTLAHALIVKRMLRRIFDHRREMVEEIFRAADPSDAGPSTDAAGQAVPRD